MISEANFILEWHDANRIDLTVDPPNNARIEFDLELDENKNKTLLRLNPLIAVRIDKEDYYGEYVLTVRMVKDNQE